MSNLKETKQLLDVIEDTDLSEEQIAFLCNSLRDASSIQ